MKNLPNYSVQLPNFSVTELFFRSPAPQISDELRL